MLGKVNHTISSTPMAIKVLLVDDEVNFQRIINQVLKREIKKEKYEFSFALNGKERYRSYQACWISGMLYPI